MKTRTLELARGFCHNLISPLAGILALAGLICGGSAVAAPRFPMAPIPSFGLIFSESWDEPYGMATNQIDPTVFVEGWDGYALNRTGQNPFAPCWAVPLLAANGEPNLEWPGAFRWWYQPEYDSASTGAAVAPLLTLVISNGPEVTVAWSLLVERDRSVIDLVGESSPTVRLRATGLSFRAGDNLMLTLCFTETNTVLWCGPNLIATGEGLPAVPAALLPDASLLVGSGPANSGLAGCGVFDDLAIFSGRSRFMAATGHPFGLSEAWDIGTYYSNTAPVAALGPVSDAELAARAQARVQRLAALQTIGTDSPMASGPAYAPLQPGVECGNGAAVSLTNTTAAFDTDLGWVVGFSVAGGTSGVDYSLYRGTNVALPFTDPGWQWLEYVQACADVTLTNQPAAGAFYRLGPEKDSTGSGMTDSWQIRFFGHLVDADADPDGDGWTNLQEFQNGTNPTVVDQPFKVLITSPAANSVIP